MTNIVHTALQKQGEAELWLTVTGISRLMCKLVKGVSIDNKMLNIKKSVKWLTPNHYGLHLMEILNLYSDLSRK